MYVCVHVCECAWVRVRRTFMTKDKREKKEKRKRKEREKKTNENKNLFIQINRQAEKHTDR